MIVGNLIGPFIDWRLFKIMRRGIIISRELSTFEILTYLNDSKSKDYTLFQSAINAFMSPAVCPADSNNTPNSKSAVHLSYLYASRAQTFWHQRSLAAKSLNG